MEALSRAGVLPTAQGKTLSDAVLYLRETFRREK
jgi:hypothetical protein